MIPFIPERYNFFIADLRSAIRAAREPDAKLPAGAGRRLGFFKVHYEAAWQTAKPQRFDAAFMHAAEKKMHFAPSFDTPVDRDCRAAARRSFAFRRFRAMCAEVVALPQVLAWRSDITAYLAAALAARPFVLSVLLEYMVWRAAGITVRSTCHQMSHDILSRQLGCPVDHAVIGGLETSFDLPAIMAWQALARRFKRSPACSHLEAMLGPADLVFTKKLRLTLPLDSLLAQWPAWSAPVVHASDAYASLAGPDDPPAGEPEAEAACRQQVAEWRRELGGILREEVDMTPNRMLLVYFDAGLPRKAGGWVVIDCNTEEPGIFSHGIGFIRLESHAPDSDVLCWLVGLLAVFFEAPLLQVYCLRPGFRGPRRAATV